MPNGSIDVQTNQPRGSTTTEKTFNQSNGGNIVASTLAQGTLKAGQAI
jgi:hypothetical protein